jgi:lysophospholipase L1-like esterase
MQNHIRKRMRRMPLLLLLLLLFTGCLGGVRSEAATVKLNRTAISMIAGRTYQLTLGSIRAEKVTWKSTKKTVASVSKTGLITARKAGKCTIVARYKGVRYTCKVTVSESQVAYKVSKLKSKYSVSENCGSIILAGSSSIRRWTDAEEDFDPFPVLNMGIGSSFVTDWLKLYRSLIVRYQPQAVIIYVGGNDIGNSSNSALAQKTADNICTLLQKLSNELPNVPIYYVSICQTITRNNAWDAVSRCNLIVKKFCKSQDNVTYIDIASRYWKNNRLIKSLFLADGIHPSERGYDIWEKYVARVVKRQLS